jgi:hypothetical protein
MRMYVELLLKSYIHLLNEFFIQDEKHANLLIDENIFKMVWFDKLLRKTVPKI